MPELTFEKVVSVSSEEKNFPAEHLLRRGEFKKWKCSSGESKAVVILQLPEANKIEKIEIGNEGSAFVEVFVSKSSIKEDDFQIILPASAFMTPAESRNNQNLSKVRFFDKDNLTKASLDRKWNIVKIVCTQPFNKNIPYGLSFITLYSPQTENKNVDLGAFSLESGPEIGSFRAGSLFEKNKQKITVGPPVKVAAALRDASLQELKAEDEEAKSTNKKAIQNSTTKKPSEAANSSKKLASSTTDFSDLPTKKSKKEENLKEQKEKPKAEFGQLLKGAVIVLSGFKNPLRSQLRDKALSMGATYKADWEDGCTHLICSFENTPKYNQIKGLGKIVKHEWIEDSFNKKELMPWRNYRLGEAPSPKRSLRNNTNGQNTLQLKTSALQTHDDADSMFDASTDSECDSNDEIERAERQASKSTHNKAENGMCSSVDLIDDLPELPNLFEGLTFLLYGEFSSEDRKYMKRHIIAYNGCLADYMGNDVTTIISCEKWDENFDQALKDYPHLVFLQPEWLTECIEQQKRIPFESYQVSKC